MKIVYDAKNATAFPFEFRCTKCRSVLLIEGLEDFTIKESDIVMCCPVCEGQMSIPWNDLTRSDEDRLRQRVEAHRATLLLRNI